MATLEEIQQPIADKVRRYETFITEILHSDSGYVSSICNYILANRGKQMRPLLVLLSAALHGEIGTRSYLGASLVEMLHTASLIHDDVVDESTERRGQLSVNAIFNNKVAVLTGDYLLATSLVHAELTNSHQIIRLVSSLGQDLADGELLQLSNVSNHSFSETVYFDVIRKKTAALFAACTAAAAYSVGVSEEEVKLARLLGEYIGICFQIKDDIFDYFDSKEIGKPTGNDMLEGKLTLPVLYALNRANDNQATEIALKVKEGTATLDEIARLIAFTKENGGIEYAVRTMNAYKQKAFGLLASLPDSAICVALRSYLDYVVDREK